MALQARSDVLNPTVQGSFFLLLFIVGLIIAFGLVAAIFGWEENVESACVQETLLVLYKESYLLSAAQDINIFSKAYALAKEPIFLQEFKEAERSQAQLIEDLLAATATNPKQQHTITTEVRPALKVLIDESQTLLNHGGANAVMVQNAAMNTVRNSLNNIVTEANRSLHVRQSTDEKLTNLFWIALVVQLIAECALIAAVLKSLKQYQRENDERVTQLRRTRDEAIAAREAAERALETKSRFLANVSHEVRTPMAGVIGLTEILSLQDLGEETNALVKGVLESSTSLLQILNNILETARLESGKVTLENTHFPVRAILGDVRQLIGSDAIKKQLIVTGSCDERIPEYVCGDEMRVRQVLLNLALNAVKFTDSGHVEITASLEEDKPGQTAIKFSVSDTGIGISEMEQKNIFRPFEQTGDTTKRVQGGVGLGLAICKELIELMGGQLGVVSAKGVGSTFWFAVPFKDGNCKL